MISSHNQKKDIHLKDNISGEQAKTIGIEYGDLMIASDISESQEERIIEILQLTLTNSEVEFWVSQLTCTRGMDTGLLSEGAQQEYKDQRALLKEHLGNPHLPHIRGLAAQNATARLQTQLSTQGLQHTCTLTKTTQNKRDCSKQNKLTNSVTFLGSFT